MLVAALVIPALIAAGPLPPIDEAHVLREYAVAVDAYALLHQLTLAGLPGEGPCRGVEQLESRRAALAEGIRFARRGAVEGSIFTADVAALFRLRLFHAVRELEMRAGDVAGTPPDPLPPPIRLEVNAFFPWEAGPPRWQVLFWALPPLPEELEYRLVGTDLVLLDPGARLVVDVLRDAVRHIPALRDEAPGPRFESRGPGVVGTHPVSGE